MASRNYATDYVVHVTDGCSNPRTRDRVASTARADVTCKRCLASLAKRDREFRAKARRWQVPHKLFRRLERLDQQESVLRGRGLSGDAARAIAREEGRAL